MLWIFVGYNSVNTSTAYAYENIEVQNQDIGCEQGVQDCDQERTNDCDDCETSNHCHSDYLAMSVSSITFAENHNLLSSKDVNKLKELNYPPGARPA